MKTNITLNPDQIRDLLPSQKVIPKKNIWDSVIKPRANISPLVRDLLPNIQKIQHNWIQLKMEFINGIKIEDQNTINENRKYLQYPNNVIKNLASIIVESSDSNDTKAYKIMLWVQDNIKYVSDIENYGISEYWTKPTETLDKMSGDCEDGAFLIHSLMLNAGIPWEDIRTYGGEVFAGAGAATGGHGWTAYSRETDNEWVVLDWCYYANDKAIGDRTPMSEDHKYIDDWFYITTHKTVETPYANKVRNPATAYDWSKTIQYLRGQRVDVAA